MSSFADTMRVIDDTPTITAGAYTAGDNVGGLITLTNTFRPDRAGQILLQSVILLDKASQSIETDVIFFSEHPGASTFTDNVAQAIDAADLGKISATVTIDTYKAFAANSVGQAQNLASVLGNDFSNKTYVALVTRGAPTYASTSDLILRVGMVML